MPRALVLFALLLLFSSGSGCAYDIEQVVLPSGYPHAERLAIHVRPAVEGDYFDRVAVRALNRTLLKWRYLFEVVTNLEDAKLDLVVTAGLANTFEVRGFGGEVAVSEEARAAEQPVPSTELSIKILDRDKGLVYDNQVTRPGHPNRSMDEAAEHLMIYYATGR